MNRSAEQWLPITGWEASYAISNFGRVRSVLRVIKLKSGLPRKIRERILKQSRNKDGRMIVTFQRHAPHKERWKPLVHRLVAIAFITNPEQKPEVNHIDGNCSHNASANLEWATQRENKDHAKKLRLNDGNIVTHVVRCVELGVTTLGAEAMSEHLRALGMDSHSSALRKHLEKRSGYHVGLRFRAVEVDELPGMNPRDFLDRLGIP